MHIDSYFKDHIPNIDLEITGRNKELVKPYLQLFFKFTTEEEKKLYSEIESTFLKLLEIKNEKTHSTIKYALMPIVLILMQGSKVEKPIKFSDLWSLLQIHIKGKLNENKQKNTIQKIMAPFIEIQYQSHCKSWELIPNDIIPIQNYCLIRRK